MRLRKMSSRLLSEVPEFALSSKVVHGSFSHDRSLVQDRDFLADRLRDLQNMGTEDITVTPGRGELDQSVFDNLRCFRDRGRFKASSKIRTFGR